MSPPVTLLMFPAAAREDRMAAVGRGEAPKEFFYGSLAMRERGGNVVFGDSRKNPDGLFDRCLLAAERLRNRVSNLGIGRQRVVALGREIAGAAAAISFTDGFSLSLGRHGRAIAGRTRLVGGFHGLADIVEEVRPAFRGYARRQIAEAVGGLDHLFFFGEADRRESIRRYAIAEARTSLFLFGVDTDFWCPGEASTDRPFVLAVGSDPKRDYPTLLAAPDAFRLRIVTRLPLKLPAGRNGVDVLSGTYYSSRLDDAGLRDLYRAAAVVVVPVRDVFQPSGYSVTLQAMACGKPVVLSRIKGLWDPDAFVSGENCLLVEPGDPIGMGAAIRALLDDPELRRRIGRRARETAEVDFGLARMNRSLERLIACVTAG